MEFEIGPLDILERFVMMNIAILPDQPSISLSRLTYPWKDRRRAAFL
jgi:hypothetical protein